MPARMPDWLILVTGALIAVGASLGSVALINRAKKPDPIQLILDRSPMFGKDFFETYYAEFPRHIVFGVRSEFAALVGLPADFLLPGDKLAQLAPAGAPEAMCDYIVALVNRDRPDLGSVVLPGRLATLDDYVRATVDICERERAAGGPGSGAPESRSMQTRTEPGLPAPAPENTSGQA